MLMFAELSIMSFLCELIDLFMFPSVKTKAIYEIYSINFVFVYQLLTDIDSTSLQFVFLLKDESKVPKKMFSKIIFLVIINSKVLERLDVSHKSWEQFGIRKENTRKQLGLYEIDHIQNPCFVTIVTNQKEYIEYFQSEYIIKEIRQSKRVKIV